MCDGSGAGGSAGLPDEGVGAHRMKRFDAAACLILALGSAGLTGCDNLPWHLDPLSINGRDGGGEPLNYATLMRIGAAAHAGGDLATAVSLYRRAASFEPRAVAPFLPPGNPLFAVGHFTDPT